MAYRLQFKRPGGIALLLTAALSGCTSSQLRDREALIGNLNIELNNIRQRNAVLEEQLATQKRELDAAGVRGPQAGLTGEGSGTEVRPPEDTMQTTSTSENLAAARNELEQERQKRLSLERELERLKSETASPYGDQRVPETDYLALKQELLDTRRTAEEDHKARERLAQELDRLQARVASDSTAPDDPARLAAIESLEREKQQLVSDLNRNLAASQQRAAELETELNELRKGNTDSTTLRSENDQLKTRLDEERRRIADLEAKLGVASRVTDLIFRLQAQQPGRGTDTKAPEAAPDRN